MSAPIALSPQAALARHMMAVWRRLRSASVPFMLLVSHSRSGISTCTAAAWAPGTQRSSRTSGSSPAANGMIQMLMVARPPGNGRGSRR